MPPRCPGGSNSSMERKPPRNPAPNPKPPMTLAVKNSHSLSRAAAAPMAPTPRANAAAPAAMTFSAVPLKVSRPVSASVPVHAKIANAPIGGDWMCHGALLTVGPMPR